METQDVSQFEIIFLDRLFVIYMYLNLLMPKNPGHIAGYFWSYMFWIILIIARKMLLITFFLKIDILNTVEKYPKTWKLNIELRSGNLNIAEIGKIENRKEWKMCCVWP